MTKLDQLKEKYEELGDEIKRLEPEPEPEPEPEEIDWAKVPVDQPVLVRDGDYSNWRLRYYAKPGCTFSDGYTSRTDHHTADWDEMKLDPDAKPIFNWKRWHGGECPVDGDVYVNYVRRDGIRCTKIAGDLRWSYEYCGGDIIWYSVAQPIDADGWPKP